MPVTTWELLEFPAGVAEQDEQHPPMWWELPAPLAGACPKGWLQRDGLHLLYTDATHKDVQVTVEQRRRSSALFYPHTSVCAITGFIVQEDEID